MGKNTWVWIAVILLIAAGMFLQSKVDIFSITGSESVTQSAPSQVNPGQSFTLTYSALGTSGTWGASITDSASGGCLFPSGSSTYKTVMLSEDGTTKSIIITAPQSGSCVFTGDYQFGSSPVKAINGLTVNICQAVCNRPADLCATSSSNGCGGTCSWTPTKNSAADTNCDNLVSRTELGVIINNWIAGTASRTDLGQAITAWIGTS